MGDLVQSGAREYVVRAAAPFYTGEEIVYYLSLIHIYHIAADLTLGAVDMIKTFQFMHDKCAPFL